MGSARTFLRNRRFTWLLALVLWLPLAQLAAATHALAHLHAAYDIGREAPAQLPASCDNCIDAAAIGGGAPPPALPAAPVLVLPSAAPFCALPAVAAAAPTLAYRSRAPPFLHA